MKTRDKIVKLLLKNGQMTVHDLADALGVSRQYVHRILAELEEEQRILKNGIAPKVVYSIQQPDAVEDKSMISFEQETFLKQHFLLIDALGNFLEGLSAMKYWCSKQQLPLNKTIEEYVLTRTKYLNFYNNEHLIDGLEKLQNTKGIGEIGVEALFYLDFYAIERFGKTRLGTLMHYAKQGQNKSLMKLIVREIEQRVRNFIESNQVDAVLFVPPTISRKVQIMDVIKKLLRLDLPIVKVQKIKGNIVVPQKALSKIFERVENAKNTFYAPKQKAYNHILIIDDAIGSGATINEIALKLKANKLAQRITGLSITGSYKGFEVISEL